MAGWIVQFLGCRRTLVYALAAVLLCTAQAGIAAVVNIPSSPTSITGTSERLISYRNQQHSWQTPDGAIHIMVNRGTVPTGDSLALYSSFDGGATWTQMLTLARTDAASTSDGMLSNIGTSSTILRLVYASEKTTGKIMYAGVTYNSTAQSWTLTTTQTAFAAPAFVGSNPAFNADSAGNFWCGFTAQDRVTLQYQVQLVYRAANTMSWISTGLVFGGTDGSSQHSARPVPLSNGVAMIYEDGPTMYWAYRLTGWAVDMPWVTSTLYTGLPPSSQNPYDSHFSVVTDGANNLHVAFVANQQLLYMRYLSGTSTWGAVRPLTSPSINAAYVQATIAAGNVVLMVNYLQSVLVLQSTDHGKTFTPTQMLVHPAPPPGSSLSYGNPRMEAPSYTMNTVPTWQQFVDGSTQGLMFFQVPVVP